MRYHITDVGASEGNGSDSIFRIDKQYNTLGFITPIIPAGQSPLHVAFCAASELSAQAYQNAMKIRKAISDSVPERQIYALNSAPRNTKESQQSAQEKHIFRVVSDITTYVIYGDQVLAWIAYFDGLTPDTVIDIIESIPGYIDDTASGSQFRSAEYLPIIHYLESYKELDKLAKINRKSLKSIVEPIEISQGEYAILPPDEFGNGRILVLKSTLDMVLTQQKITLSAPHARVCKVQKSLTEVIPGEFSFWPSSNHFHNPDLATVNVGTRWAPGTTSATDPVVAQFTGQLAKHVGGRGRLS